VLLLDEPLSALDAQVRLTLREEISRLQKNLGITTIFVTHDQEEALSMADRVAVLRDGRLEQCATPVELYHHPATAFVAEFVGTMNRVPGRLTGSGAVEVAGQRLPVLGDVPAENTVDVLIRPEDVRVSADADGAARVVTVSFLGPTTRLFVQLPGGVGIKADLVTRQAAGLAPGAPVKVELADHPVRVAAAR
jgi:putative spermidine/putrescine transport system ATP-binding protein